MNGVYGRSLRTVGVGLVAIAALLAGGAAVSAAPRVDAPEPPGPVQDLALSPVEGGGARAIGFEATWTAPTENGDGIRTHYVVETHDATGARLHSAATGATTAGPIRGDRCRGPLTFSVRAVTQDPHGGDPINGPTVLSEFGKPDLCEIHMSLSAEQTGPGTVHVEAAREQPVDPYVAGPCELTVDGAPAWSGTCGGATGWSTTLDGLAPGTHGLVLTTVSPRGETYVARTSATVG
ncbi:MULTISPECIES: hypothetical protein [Pseudonocardia]|uniref:Fibronectin type-III domain-containing protein n=2 Tax=Pseudonocardia TaxID=1847 RepID=A0A1Y2N8Z6_PSEAH|nr:MULTISPECIES: hypothetical protein [Pseudonocardia]OSY43537.1 hypothetical protein BG845_00480 [Pseudonocardia autotrophica]TDN73471.1 hypothetical protein C8E95_2569 [Pseudonocardia autotrophica]BBG04212.1 hypothetical protein Pdca_54210 [Pseudonocardia autotrophica]GEC29150.1 hypothetical protein PSA01_61790 [Pseudonocardia saturnea]